LCEPAQSEAKGPGLRFKGICHGATICKNRDKQMHFIVRVMFRPEFRVKAEVIF